MKTVHLIFNAHLDPIWLWPWHAGLAEAISTARSVCDQLDECDDLIFTRGESWFYQQIQTHDPKLFERISQHIANGRWEIVGGWYVQPDCNLPSDWGLEKQVQLGREYFQKQFGQFPDTAYNVDSFGHAATLPRLMHEAGQRNYIMMRPQEHEKQLPARLFRWQGEPDGPMVTTFRIASAYCTSFAEIAPEHIRSSLEHLPEGIDHTMCFIGLGDHGGGPSRAQTQWCRENAHVFDGAQLEFSSPSRFFAAIADDLDKLPVVQGDLQHHAIGCYCVDRPTKVLLRKAEYELRAAESVTSLRDETAMQQAWEHVCFHQFHDTLGGTCIPSAYPIIHAQLGAARSTADRLLRHQVIAHAQALTPDSRQRILLYNPSESVFEGYVEVEPWMEFNRWREHWQLETPAGEPIDYQLIDAEAPTQGMVRLTFACQIEPHGICVACINTNPAKSLEESPQKQNVTVEHLLSISNALGDRVALGQSAEFILDGRTFSFPRLVLQHDTSDTWSHNIACYDEPVIDAVRIEQTRLVAQGPLLASIMQTGRIEHSPFTATWRLYANHPGVMLDLHVDWVERHRVLKLVWDLPEVCQYRIDGIPGGSLQRQPEGKECPLQDWLQLVLADSSRLAIACPDVFALDGDAKCVRLTLLRGAIMAHHEPHDGKIPSARYADQGSHDFHFWFTTGSDDMSGRLDQYATQHWQKPLMTDWTLGMPSRLTRTQ